jgi:N-acetylneuraminic acid mutarotase
LMAFSVFAAPFLVIDKVYAQEDGYWTTLEPMPTARYGLGVAVVNGKIYAIGGQTGLLGAGYSILSVNEEYDPATDTWSSKTPMPTARTEFGIAVYENKIYCIGGYGPQEYVGLGTNEVYDPATDTWETLASLPTPRYDVQANALYGRIYVTGGNSSLIEVYNPAKDSWTTKEPTPATRIETFCVSGVVNNKIYVIGPGDENQIYDPLTNSWTTGAAKPSPAYIASGAATTGVNAPPRIFVFGITQAYWTLTVPDFVTLVYTPETNSWSYGSAMQTGRINAGVAVVNGVLYVIGGETISVFRLNQRSAENEQYTPADYVPEVPIPEFPSWTPMLILLVAVLAVAVIYKQKLHKQNWRRDNQ